MRPRLLHILFGITTFLLGSVFALITLSSIEGKLPSIEAVPIPNSDQKEQVEIGSLTFDEVGVIACGSDGEARASWSSVRASDGVMVSSTLLLFETRSVAEKRLEKLASRSDQVLERGPYTNYWNVKVGERLLVKKGKEFTLVTYVPVKYSQSTTTFNLRVLSSKSLDHLREFDRQSESLRRSEQINRLNP